MREESGKLPADGQNVCFLNGCLIIIGAGWTKEGQFRHSLRLPINGRLLNIKSKYLCCARSIYCEARSQCYRNSRTSLAAFQWLFILNPSTATTIPKLVPSLHLCKLHHVCAQIAASTFYKLFSLWLQIALSVGGICNSTDHFVWPYPNR